MGDIEDMEFTLKPEHIKLLRRAYIRTSEYETGAPEIDGKRPYGNSYVAGDVAEILGIKVGEDGLTDEQARELLDLHYETTTALQVILTTGSFEPGEFVKRDRYDFTSWERRPKRGKKR